MFRVRLLLASILVLCLSGSALAQSRDLELTAYGGYNLGGSIDVRENALYKLDTKDSFATGLSLTWQRGPSNAFEIFWGYRPTHVEGINPNTLKKADFITLNEHDFHANFLFMPAYRQSKVIPFFLLGLGVTVLDPGDVAGLSPDTKTKFSWALGAGFKTYFSEKFGLRGQVRYHSTYISDENNGTWCDPYYGCYNTVDTNWLDEWDFNGGLILKLGK